MAKAANEKKLRSDAWEAPLSAELREKFYFAIEPLDFPEGTALAAKEPYSLRATSMQAYYRCQARARAAIEKAKTRAAALRRSRPRRPSRRSSGRRRSTPSATA